MEAAEIARKKSYFPAEFFGICGPEGGEAALVQGLADAFHEFVIKIQVVHHRQPQGQDLLGLEQVVQIGPGVAAADGAVALGVDGAFIGLVLGVFQVDRALPGEEPGVPGVPSSA